MDILNIESKDLDLLDTIKSILRDINVLGHEENYPELGKYLNYFKDKYGQEVVNKIINI